MTRKTVEKLLTDVASTALPPPSPLGQTAAPTEPETNSETNSEINCPLTASSPAKGTPRRLTAQLLDTLCADFETHGADAIRSCREEQPQGYLRLIAGLLPKELDLNDNRLKDIPDAELVTLIERFRERIARREGAAGLGE